MALKAYPSKKAAAFLKKHGLKNGLQKKAVRGKPLTERQKVRNQLIGKKRYVVERTFGSQALWHGGKDFRYVGLAKAHTWHNCKHWHVNQKTLANVGCK